MKKIYLLALAVIVCAFLSCQKAEEPAAPDVPAAETPLPEGSFQARLYFDLGQNTSRAFGSGTTEPWEKVINRATVFVFNASMVLIYRRDLTPAEIESLSKNPLTITVDGGVPEYNTYFTVVANRTISADIRSRTALLKEMEPDFAPYNGTFEEVTTKAMHPEGFAMSADASVRINTTGITPVSLTLKRVVAKFELRAQTTAAFSQKYGAATVTVGDIMLQRLCDRSYIIEQLNMLFPVNGNRVLRQQAVANQNLFYLFERPKDSNNSLTELSLPCVFDTDGKDSTTDDRFSVTYKITLDGAGSGQFKRNEAYFINVNINGIHATDVSATITLADWAIGGTQNVEVG